jgi:hypothetical protein
MTKNNCWDHFQCGRQPGGEKAREIGICPAASQTILNGFNEGINGGRACWAIAGTLCKGKTQGTYAQKLGDCLRCEFYASVRQDQGGSLVTTKEILKKLNGHGS